MTRISILLLILVLGLQFPVGANAGSLWQEANTGMQLPEILSKFSDAVAIDGETLHSGAKEQANILHYKVSNIDFRVRFFFLNGGLSQVTLSSNISENQSTFENMLDAKRLEIILKTKYGEPLSREEKHGLLNVY